MAKPIPVSSARTGRAVHTGTGRDGFHPPLPRGRPPLAGSFVLIVGHDGNMVFRWERVGPRYATRMAVELSTIPSAPGTSPPDSASDPVR